MVRTKVFVGNLSFKTREPGLLQAFQAAGTVVHAQIVTRGQNRSLGYGFVEFESEDGANKAIKELNKTTIDEREVNVELAKPRQEGAPARRPPFRPSYNNRGSSYRRYNDRGYNTGYSGARRGSRGAPRGGRGGPRGGLGRVPRPKRTLEERNLQPSNTTVFVTNIPFKFTESEFAKVFVDAGVNPKNVKIATRFNGRSRGYGFAEFESQADQQKAMAAVDKSTVEGRELVVKIAMVDPNQPPKSAQPAQQQPAQQQPAQQPPQQQPAPPAQQQPAKPAQPTQPAQPPAQPAQPAQPAKPAQPAQPAQQTQQPAKPAQPAQPAQQPAQPKPAQPSAQPAKSQSQSPNQKKK